MRAICERFEGVARVLRDVLTQRWLLTEQTYQQANAKRVYYLSMEFLLGRTLIHNIINLGVEQFVRDDLRSDPRQNWTAVIDAEPMLDWNGRIRVARGVLYGLLWL